MNAVLIMTGTTMTADKFLTIAVIAIGLAVSGCMENDEYPHNWHHDWDTGTVTENGSVGDASKHVHPMFHDKYRHLQTDDSTGIQ